MKLNDNVNIKSEQTVKLVGVKFDHQLNFNTYVNEICQKGARQLNGLKRIGNNLSIKCKLAIIVCFILL